MHKKSKTNYFSLLHELLNWFVKFQSGLQILHRKTDHFETKAADYVLCFVLTIPSPRTAPLTCPFPSKLVRNSVNTLNIKIGRLQGEPRQVDTGITGLTQAGGHRIYRVNPGRRTQGLQG